jgi:ribosomal protein S18 acetylase RimI-like enzyme
MSDHTMNDLARRALAVHRAWLQLGNAVTTTELGTFVRNERAPLIWDANHVAEARAATPAALDALLAHVEREYAHCGHRRFDLDEATPAALEARLVAAGYQMRRFEVMAIEGPLAGTSKTYDIRPLAGADAWVAFERLHRLDWLESAARLGLSGDLAVAEQGALVHRAQSPPARWWLAYDAGEPRGYFSSWQGIGGVGQVEDLFVHPDHRRRGIATALVHHAVADARAHGAGPVVLVVDPDDTPRHMYAAMGFRVLAEKRDLLRHG